MTERVVDLENKRYADREPDPALAEAVLVPGLPEEERVRAERQHEALARLRRRVRSKPSPRGVFLSLSDLTDLLIVLGLDDW